MVACKEDDKTMGMVEVMIFLVYILLYIFFAFVWGRSVINGYIEYAFKPWEESVIRKNMNWKEWAFFSRFRSVLPKSLLYPYYFFVFFYPLGFAVCFLSLLFLPEYFADFLWDVYSFVVEIHGICIIAFYVLFWTKERGRVTYRRWYKRPSDEVRREIRLKYMEKREDLLEENQEQVQQKGRKKTTGNRRKPGTRRKGKKEGNKKKK